MYYFFSSICQLRRDFMRKSGARQICLTMAACLFGAGFISGQELWQFFGCFGTIGMACMAVSGILISLLTFMTARFSSIFKTSEMDRIVIPFKSKTVTMLTGIIELSLMFFIYVIMVAGVGTLSKNLSGSRTIGICSAFIFCSAVTAVSLKGIGEALKIFGIAVPITVTVALMTAVGATVQYGLPTLHFEAEALGNPLISNPIASMLSFVSYNFFCAVGTVASVGKSIDSKKQTALGAFAGGILLTTVALLIILATRTVDGAHYNELPLLSIAGSMAVSVKYTVAIALIIAMFGASLSVFVPIPDYIGKFRFCRRYTALCSALLSLLAAVLSIFGFSNLIGVIYPIYGYIAILAMAGIIVNYLKAIHYERRRQ